MKNGDLVMADASEDYEGIAKTVEVKNIGNKAVFSGLHTFLMRDRNSVFADGIRGYIHKMPDVHHQIQKIATGLKVFGVSKNTLKNIVIPIPKIEEKKAIATVLSDIDSLIESLKKLITKKCDIKTATMQQLLTGKRRLPGFGDGKLGYKKTDIGLIPKDWNISRLNSVCTFENGDRGFNYPSKFDFKLFGVPFVNAGHLKDKKISHDKVDYITLEKYEQLGGGKLKHGDILFCLRGSLGKYAVIKDKNVLGAIASSLIIIRSKEGFLERDFFEFYLESSCCKEMIELFASGAAQPNLGGKDLSKFYIALPSKDEQQAIASILSDMDTEIQSLERMLKKTKAIKTGIMQELLTGRTRLI